MNWGFNHWGGCRNNSCLKLRVKPHDFSVIIEISQVLFRFLHNCERINSNYNQYSCKVLNNSVGQKGPSLQKVLVHPPKPFPPHGLNQLYLLYDMLVWSVHPNIQFFSFLQLYIPIFQVLHILSYIIIYVIYFSCLKSAPSLPPGKTFELPKPEDRILPLVFSSIGSLIAVILSAAPNASLLNLSHSYCSLPDSISPESWCPG